MKRGWGLRRKLRKAAAALVAFALLPVAVLVAVHAATPAAPSLTHAPVAGADLDLPAVDALQRSEASNLFAPFAWDGQTVSGPFVTFSFYPSTGWAVGFLAVNGTQRELLVDSIHIVDFWPGLPPEVSGSLFTASGNGASLVAHDEPSALLEIRTGSEPREVVFTFPFNTSNVAASNAMVWPRASLSFSMGDATGRIILGRGTFSVNGTSVIAQLQAYDYLAFRAVPSFVEHRAERAALLDAFGSGLLAFEANIVAMTNGAWLETSAHFGPSIATSSDGVTFNQATVTVNAPETEEGLLVLAFDPQTMPSGSGHQIVVTDEGTPIPETTNPLAALYADIGGSPGQASFSLLPMNATVVVVYLPQVTTTSLTIQSLPLPAPGPDPATELAMVAALFVVSVAAAVMFKPRRV